MLIDFLRLRTSSLCRVIFLGSNHNSQTALLEPLAEKNFMYIDELKHNEKIVIWRWAIKNGVREMGRRKTGNAEKKMKSYNGGLF